MHYPLETVESLTFAEMVIALETIEDQKTRDRQKLAEILISVTHYNHYLTADFKDSYRRQAEENRQKIREYLTGVQAIRYTPLSDEEKERIFLQAAERDRLTRQQKALTV